MPDFYMFNKKITKIKRFWCLMQAYGIMKLQKSTFSFGSQITLQQGDMDMKKRVTFLAALLVAACFGATVAMAEGSAKVTAQSGLNMRQGPGINYNVVTVLSNGATVNVVTPDDGNGWTYVTSGKNAGWVATKYLSGSAATTQAPSWRGSAVNCTVKSDANIRRGPGTDFGVLGVVPAGFTVSVDSYQDGWASVTWGDVSGYIATKLLNGLPAANGGTSTAGNSTSGRYEGADVTCTLNSDANLRSGPATSYEVLTAVPAGFTVTVHSYANGWSCVTWGDTTGYISNSLINGLPTANGGKGGSSSGSTAGTSWYGGHDYSNVYDYSYYRSQNADLRAAFGNDANAYLQHFVNYGMAEGRQGRASFNVYTYRDEHPELWEKFGDNLRGYYLWACGIPQ